MSMIRTLCGKDNSDMETIENTMEFKLHNTAVCLGKFDGIHIGHQLLLNRIVKEKSKGRASVVFTFALHPANLFSDKKIDLIDTQEEKKKKLQESGVDILISYPFTKETASMEPERFIEEVLVGQLDVKVIVIGRDFHFGYKRKGNVELLKKMAQKYSYEVIDYDKITYKGEIVSSTRIRSSIEKGDLELAASLLGRPYEITEEVLHGQQLGRTIGVPTINQTVVPEKILPANGVYVSTVRIGQKTYGAITNIGCKPTVGELFQKGVETNIFDYSGDLYGRIITVQLHAFVRGERKFESVNTLVCQMHKDIAYAKEYLNREGFMGVEGFRRTVTE